MSKHIKRRRNEGYAIVVGGIPLGRKKPKRASADRIE